MPPRRLISALLLGILLVAPARGQDDLKKKQSQLDKLRKEIGVYEGKIREKEKKEHATLDLLDSYDRQMILLRKLIARLREQGTGLQRDIDQTRRTIGDLNGQLVFLRQQYARYVSTLYRNGRTYDLELLLSSRSVNQMLIRSEYLKRFSDQRKEDLENIDNRRKELETQSALLQSQLAEQRQLLADKRSDEATLASKVKKRKTLLAVIRRDKKNYAREVDRKRQSAKDLEQLIARLIEEERAKEERERSLVKEGKLPPRPPSVGGAFEVRRGRLPWPVAGGKITARFGNREHPTLHTVTQNTGIDIAVPPGTDVDAVADGDVGIISWLPSYGNLVILNHQGGYRTVYAHLSDISVSEGEHVKEGESIGKSGEAVAGAMVHFEIYKDREKQDPELWLRPRGLSQR